MNAIAEVSHHADLDAVHALSNAARSQTAWNWMRGAAVLVGAAGISTAAVIWAWNHKLDLEAVKEVLSSLPPIKVTGEVTATGTVKMQPGEVSLKQPATVMLDPNSRLPAPAIFPPLPPSPAISREVVVFTSQPHGDGAVTTGWTFKNGETDAPINQFCYFSRRIDDGMTSKREEVGQNRNIASESPKGVTLPEQRERFVKCAWFTPGAAKSREEATPKKAKLAATDLDFFRSLPKTTPNLDGDGKVTRFKSRTGDAIALVIEGGVDASMVADFRSHIAASREAGLRIAAVILSSSGGRLDYGFDLAKTARDELPETPIVVRDRCISSCSIFAFMAGPQRLFLEPGGSIELHYVQSQGANDEWWANVGETRKVAEKLHQAGVPHAPLQRLLVSSVQETVLLTPEELREAGVTIL